MSRSEIGEILEKVCNYFLEHEKIWDWVRRRVSVECHLHRGTGAQEVFSLDRLPVRSGGCRLAVFLVVDCLSHPGPPATSVPCAGVLIFPWSGLWSISIVL